MALWNQARICPKCGSTDVGVDDRQVLTMLRLQDGYLCRSCGYAGIFPLVDEDSISDQRKEIEQFDDDGKLDALSTSARPSKRRVLYGIAFFLVGIPPTLYATGVEGRLVGILSMAIGGTIVFEYFTNTDETPQEAEESVEQPDDDTAERSETDDN